MAKGRRLTLRIAFMLAAVAVVFGGIAAVRRWRPLGGPRLVEHIDSMSQSSMQEFLDGDFRIVRDMKALPEPVVKAFTEEGGSRLTIANPGERFEATDVIWDKSLPRRRLLFAGISGVKSFVLYERGGIGLSHILALFQLGTASTTPAMWQTFCVPAASLEELRTHISQGKCSRPTASRRPR